MYVPNYVKHFPVGSKQQTVDQFADSSEDESLAPGISRLWLMAGVLTMFNFSLCRDGASEWLITFIFVL